METDRAADRMTDPGQDLYSLLERSAAAGGNGRAGFRRRESPLRILERTSPSALDLARPLLLAAARPALTRIRRDREKVPEKLVPLLVYLEEHLFEKGLNVTRLKKACGIRDNSLTLVFHSEVGESPKAYISNRRLETAARLLSETELRAWQIAELVGYSSLGVFGKAFYRWSGLRPLTFRKHTQEAAVAAATASDTVDEDMLRQALKGNLPAGQAQILIRRLVALYRNRDNGS